MFLKYGLLPLFFFTILVTELKGALDYPTFFDPAILQMSSRQPTDTGTDQLSTYPPTARIDESALSVSEQALFKKNQYFFVDYFPLNVKFPYNFNKKNQTTGETLEQTIDRNGCTLIASGTTMYRKKIVRDLRLFHSPLPEDLRLFVVYRDPITQEYTAHLLRNPGFVKTINFCMKSYYHRPYSLRKATDLDDLLKKFVAPVMRACFGESICQPSIHSEGPQIIVRQEAHASNVLMQNLFGENSSRTESKDLPLDRQEIPSPAAPINNSIETIDKKLNENNQPSEKISAAEDISKIARDETRKTEKPIYKKSLNATSMKTKKNDKKAQERKKELEKDKRLQAINQSRKDKAAAQALKELRIEQEIKRNEQAELSRIKEQKIKQAEQDRANTAAKKLAEKIAAEALLKKELEEARFLEEQKALAQKEALRIASLKQKQEDAEKKKAEKLKKIEEEKKQAEECARKKEQEAAENARKDAIKKADDARRKEIIKRVEEGRRIQAEKEAELQAKMSIIEAAISTPEKCKAYINQQSLLLQDRTRQASLEQRKKIDDLLLKIRTEPERFTFTLENQGLVSPTEQEYAFNLGVLSVINLKSYPRDPNVQIIEKYCEDIIRKASNFFA